MNLPPSTPSPLYRKIQQNRLSLASSKNSLIIDSPRALNSPSHFKTSNSTFPRKTDKTLTLEPNSFDSSNVPMRNSGNKLMKSATIIIPQMSHNRMVSTTQKSVKFKSGLDEIEEDIGQDYLLGSGKLLKMNSPRSPISKQHARSKTEANFKKTDDTYISNTPKDFIKNSYNYDPNFKKTFDAFLNGEADLKSLMDIKNFPSLYYFNPKEKHKLTYFNQNKVQTPLTERRLVFTQRTDKRKESSTSREKKCTSSPTKSKVLKHFDQIKEIIKNRLILKKKIKKEAFFLNDWNVKFFQNFYSITKEYIEKIKKKDLITVNVNKNYYENSLPTAQRLMKGFTLMNYTKSPSKKQ